MAEEEAFVEIVWRGVSIFGMAVEELPDGLWIQEALVLRLARRRRVTGITLGVTMPWLRCTLQRVYVPSSGSTPAARGALALP